jgi:hypothetical protein
MLQEREPHDSFDITAPNFRSLELGAGDGPEEVQGGMAIIGDRAESPALSETERLFHGLRVGVVAAIRSSYARC